MTPTVPNKEITAQALGAGLVAVVFGAIAWGLPSVPPPPAGLEAGTAVVAGALVVLIRKYMRRRKMTEIEREVDKNICAGRNSPKK